MPRRKKKQVQWLFADFETCYDVDKINELKATSDKFTQDDFARLVQSRVYGAGWSYGQNTEEIDANYSLAESEVPLLTFIHNFLDGNDEDNKKYDLMRAYFHNLNFDIQFMKDWLLNGLDGYEVEVVGPERKLYQVKIKNPHTKKELWLLDSLNVLRMKLSEFAEELHLDGVSKRSDVLEQDMSITRPLDHRLTEDEKIYLKEDVRILAYGVLDYFKDKDWHLTSSSYAFKEFQKELKKRSLQHYFNLSRTGHMQNYDMKRFNYYNYHSMVDTEKKHIDVLKRFEKYYKGGQTFNNPVYQEQVLEMVTGLDVNSLYPFSFTQCKVPYVSNIQSKIIPKRIKFDTAKTIKLDSLDNLYEPISMYECKSQADLRENYFLCYNIIMDIELKEEFTFSPVSIGFCDEVLEIHEFIDDKVRDIKKARVAFAGSEYDLANWQVYYNITNCELVEYFIFDIMKGEDLKRFRGIMNEWSEAKIYYSKPETSDKAKKALYKLFMNSLTGKFGEKIRDTKTVIKDHEFTEIEDDNVNTRMLPMIISLISFARLYMSRNIAKVKEDFVYCDTDSIYVVNRSDEELEQLYEMHDTTLGCFKLEKTYEKALFQKPKTYVGILNGEFCFTVAGCQVQKELYSRYQIEEFLDNDKVIGKKILKLPCIGGVYLADRPFVFKGDDGDINEKIKRMRCGYLEYLFGRFDTPTNHEIETEHNLKEYDFTYNHVDSTYSSIINPVKET